MSKATNYNNARIVRNAKKAKKLTDTKCQKSSTCQKDNWKPLVSREEGLKKVSEYFEKFI